MIRVKQKGNFSKAKKYLVNVQKLTKHIDLDTIAKEGIKALETATPVDTGLTAKSWTYEILKKSGKTVISFTNANIQNGIPIAIILQYGHATKNGGWVEGRDYINSSIQPIFDSMLDKMWKEVTKL